MAGVADRDPLLARVFALVLFCVLLVAAVVLPQLLLLLVPLTLAVLLRWLERTERVRKRRAWAAIVGVGGLLVVAGGAVAGAGSRPDPTVGLVLGGGLVAVGLMLVGAGALFLLGLRYGTYGD